MDALLSLPLNYSLFIDMEKNKPINVALDDIRYKPEIINNLEYRFINDDLGMVISFIQMGSKLFQIRQPYRAKEGRIIRVLQGTGRISINLIEYEISARKIIIIPNNSLIEMLEISSDYDFQVIMPAYISCLPCQILFCRKLTQETVSYCHLMRKNGPKQSCSLFCYGKYFILHLIVVKPYNISLYPYFVTSNIFTSKHIPPLPCAFHVRKKYSAVS